ncbi:anthranilate synthase component I family protein [Halorubrum vacuolatum]|uniref:anthranilate synthase n=1 Tax=Halorubrum vacuolatum TaxID=63740 RepID=A0A238UVA5_HALVU|nr:anthranilate synthase component I family protein [Halorubrum vacuolatum]SNR25667.1 aminodeoxychorismate synthase, subunit I [Halorubrum vacuolatum]
MSERVHTDRERFRAVAAMAPPNARVPVECRVTVEDPFAAYRRARDGTGGFFYETTGGQPGWGYFGIEPCDRLTAFADAVVANRPGSEAEDDVDTSDGGANDDDGGANDDDGEANDDDGGTDDDGEEPAGSGNAPATDRSPTGDYRRDAPTLSALDGLLAGESLARGDCTVPYPCGVFGWLSYDVARELERFPPAGPDGPGAIDDRGLPRLQVGVFDRLAAWKCPTADGEPTTLRVTACPTIPGDLTDPVADATALDAHFEAGVASARELIERIETGDPEVGPAPASGSAATFESHTGREAYAEAVRTVKRYVRDGDTFQANISQRLEAPAAVHPVEAYDALREVNPAPYSGLIEFGGGGERSGADLVSASPELLLERVPAAGEVGDGDIDDGDGDGTGARLVTEPIAGTRPRGEDAATDAAMEAELTGDEKERAEHAMLVDLERNDLGKVSQFGTVTVPEYRRVDRYSEVMHLVSVVEGEARPDVSLADAIAACFPGGTITGAPKPRTMEIIDELERTRRGPYTGSMLAAGFDGRATLNIVIRTLVRHADEYHLRVGAGVVHDSDPDAEYEETLAKGRALVTAIDEALEAGRMNVEGHAR